MLFMFLFVLQVFLSGQCFQKVAREDIKARKWVALHNLVPVFMGRCLYGRGTRLPKAQPTRSRLSTIPSPSYPPQQDKGSLRLKQSLVAPIQSTLQNNVLILCAHDKS